MDRIEQLKNFLQENPNDNFLIHALALEYIKAGNDKEAQNYFEQNLLKAPDYIPTYYHLGKLLERNGDTESAVNIYFKGMETAKTANDLHALSELRSVYEDLLY